MQRAIFWLDVPGICCLAFSVMVMTSSVSNAQVLDYVCEGQIRTDRVFEPDGVSVENQRFRITANVTAGYVKRDPALAAGCFAGRTEVCACEPPSAEKIICRSLGFRADGTEVSLDFTLRPSNRLLIVSGKEFNARSGTLIERQGELICTRSLAVSSP
jgi:hypothetical protein